MHSLSVFALTVLYKSFLINIFVEKNSKGKNSQIATAQDSRDRHTGKRRELRITVKGSTNEENSGRQKKGPHRKIIYHEESGE